MTLLLVPWTHFTSLGLVSTVNHFFSIHNFANKCTYPICIYLCHTTNAQRVLVSKKQTKKKLSGLNGLQGMDGVFQA